MKEYLHNFYHFLNTVRKSNSIKPFIWYEINNITYFITRVMRALNY